MLWMLELSRYVLFRPRTLSQAQVKLGLSGKRKQGDHHLMCALERTFLGRGLYKRLWTCFGEETVLKCSPKSLNQSGPTDSLLG
jgi:hypothetical protein